MIQQEEVTRMKRRVLVMAAAVAAIILAAAVSQAAEKGDVGAMWWGKNPLARPTVMGIVEASSPASVSVKTKRSTLSFRVTQRTAVFVLGKKASIADVKPGDSVVVRYEPTRDAVPVALGILVPRPSVSGVITALDGNLITLKSKQTTVKVAVSPDTTYHAQRYIGTAEDLRVGYTAMISCVENNGILGAVRVAFVPETAKGTVVAINGNVLTVKTIRQREIAVQAGPATAITIRPRIGPNTKGSPADVQIGSPVNIGFHRATGVPCQLLWIDVFTGM